MVVVWILLGILAVLLLLMFVSLTLYVEVTDEVRIRGGALGYKRDLHSPEKEERDRLKPKKKKRKKRKKKEKTAEKPKDAKRTGPKKKKGFSETVDEIMDWIKILFHPVTFVLRHIRLTHVRVLVSVGCEDADKTALTYAGISMAAGNTIALLKSQIAVKVKRVDIRADFQSQEIRQDISFRVKLRIGMIIAGLLGMLYYMCKNTLQSQKPNGESE